MAPRLRPTGPEDFDALRALFDDPSFRDWGGVGVLPDEALRQKYLGARLPDVECFLVLVHARPVGLAQIYGHAPGDSGGMDLILLPAARGHGVGRAVVDALAARARRHHGWRVLTVDPDVTNEGAVAFWEAVGFRRVRIVPNADGRAHFWLMSLSLAAAGQLADDAESGG